MQRFGEKLRTLRLRQGMTMQQLADALGYNSTGYISDIETGRNTPSLKFAMKVAQVFQVKPDQLLLDDVELDSE